MMNYQKLDVSIIIVNYNTYSFVLDCIKSIKEKTKNISYEIILVDNDSPNRQIENLNEVYPDIQLVLNKENNGFGSGNNLGTKLAKGDYLFFLNSDTFLMNDAISILFTFINKNTDVAVVGGNLYTKDGKPNTSFSVMQPSIFLDIDYFFFNVFSKIIFKRNVNFNYSNEILQLKGSVSGADYMIRKDIFEDLKGFDEDFFMYYEETELSYRVLKKGFKIYNIPAAKIVHYEGGSEIIKERSLDWSLDSKKKYFIKTSNILSFYISNVIFFITILQRILLFSVINNKAKRKYWKQFLKWSLTKIK